MSNFYLYVELVGDAPTIAESVRTALAEFVYPDEYNMVLADAKLAIEV